jgi:hypothetical protein
MDITEAVLDLGGRMMLNWVFGKIVSDNTGRIKVAFDGIQLQTFCRRFSEQREFLCQQCNCPHLNDYLVPWNYTSFEWEDDYYDELGRRPSLRALSYYLNTCLEELKRISRNLSR